MLNWELLPRVTPSAEITGYMHRFTQARLLCVGDVMLDCYLSGPVVRISPEAPVPVVEIERETWMPGGMANACANAAALGATVLPVGVIGDDAAGERLLAELGGRGIWGSGLVRAAGRKTTVKTRIVAGWQQAGSQQIVRVDAEVRSPVSGAVECQVIERVRDRLPHVDAVLICDYAKGALTAAILGETIGGARARGIPVCIDPKRANFAEYRGATVVTPNLKEAAAYAGLTIESVSDLALAAVRLIRAANCAYLVITLGPHGMALAAGDSWLEYVPGKARQVFDVGGAGDTAVATLGLSLAAGAPIADAVYLANVAAGLVVEKRGTATIEVDELRAALAAAVPEPERALAEAGS